MSRQNAILQPQPQASESNISGLNAAPEEQNSASAWPYFLIGLLMLGGSAAWVMGRRHKPMVTPLPVPPSDSRPERHEASPSPSGLDAKPQAVDKAESASPEEQYDAPIRLLKSHIGQNPGESPVPWLLLLDLLHRTGNAQEYEQARQQCKQHFNVDMPAYKKIQGASARQGIESYPHIMSKLIRFWPGEEATSYLNALLHDSRDGSRVGFDLATYHDIALLRSILETVSDFRDA